MKRYITIIAALLTLSVAVFAQDSRNRVTTTIVSDVLAQMPAQTADVFKAQMADLAKSAPESVEVLAGMLQAPEKGANNLIEYALNGVCNYATDPANAELTPAVLKGFQNAAAKMADATNKQFLETQIRLLSPAAQPAPVFTSVNDKQFSKLWDKATPKNVIKALKSTDPAYRVTALRTADQFAGEEFYSLIAKNFDKFPADTKAELIYWLGIHGAASQIDLINSQIAQPGQLGLNAIDAAGRIGGEAAADALIAQLGGANNDAATEALLRFNGDVRDKIAAALKGAEGAAIDPLMKLASSRRIKSVAPVIFGYAEDKDHAAAAVENLAGVVAPFQAEKIAKMLDNADAASVAPLQNAFESALSKLTVGERYADINSIIKSAKNKSRFYKALASVGTDSAVKDLAAAYNNGDAAALGALMTMDNYSAANTLLKAAQGGDQNALSRFVTLVNANEQAPDRKYNKLMQAYGLANTDALKANVVSALGDVPTLDSFISLSKFLDSSNAKEAYNAANAVKSVASKCIDDIDTKVLKNTLTKAADLLSKTGDADDGYAVDEIRNYLNTVEDNSPIFVLSDEEKAEGFEVLFDGTNLDKWTGNKVGYVPVNGTIYVTAQYGDEMNLYTIKEYKDFVFRFEFCFVRPGANNGVGVRTPMGVDAAYYGMCEVQILDHDDPIYANLRPYQVHGSVYGVIPAKRIVHKPLGEWGTEEIRVKGNHITVTVNGEVVVDGDIKEACKGHNVAPKGETSNPYTVDHQDHPGMFNKTGHIGFLGHGAGVKFRNVRVKEL